MRTFLLCFALALIFILTGCDQKSPGQQVKQKVYGSVLAKVNGTPITDIQRDNWIKEIRQKNITQPLQEKALQKLIRNEIMYQKALELKLDEDPNYQYELWAFQRKKMMRKLFEWQASKVKVTSENIKKYFNDNVKKIKVDYHFSLLRFKTEAEAVRASKLIESGISFEKIPNHKAFASKQDFTFQDMGFRGWHKLKIEWIDGITSLKSGETSKPLPGNMMYNNVLVHLVEKRDNSKITFDQCRGTIVRKQRDDQYMNFYKDLEKTAKIDYTTQPASTTSK